MISHSVADTENIAAEFARKIAPGTVLFFRGDLGAGKTAFVRGLAMGLNIPAEYVSSPTYTFVKEYKILPSDDKLYELIEPEEKVPEEKSENEQYVLTPKYNTNTKIIYVNENLDDGIKRNSENELEALFNNNERGKVSKLWNRKKK